jgi:hypothetical protein
VLVAAAVCAVSVVPTLRPLAVAKAAASTAAESLAYIKKTTAPSIASPATGISSKLHSIVKRMTDEPCWLFRRARDIDR